MSEFSELTDGDLDRAENAIRTLNKKRDLILSSTFSNEDYYFALKCYVVGLAHGRSDAGQTEQHTAYGQVIDIKVTPDLPPIDEVVRKYISGMLDRSEHKLNNLGFRAELEGERKRLSDIVNACRWLLREGSLEQ